MTLTLLHNFILIWQCGVLLTRTLCEGELVWDLDPERKSYVPRLLLHDVMVTSGVSVYHQPHATRMQIAQVQTPTLSFLSVYL